MKKYFDAEDNIYEGKQIQNGLYIVDGCDVLHFQFYSI